MGFSFQIQFDSLTAKTYESYAASTTSMSYDFAEKRNTSLLLFHFFFPS